MSYRRPKYEVDELAREPWRRREDDPPFCPNIRASRDVEEILPLIAGMLVRYFEDGVDTNAIRRMAFNIISEGGYENSEFVSLMEIAVLGIEAALIDSPRSRPVDIVRNVTEELVNMYCGQIADQIPELERGRGVGPDVYDAAVRYGRQLEDTIRDCKAVIDRASRASRDYDRRDDRYDRRDRGRGSDRNGSAYTRTSFDMGSGNRTSNRDTDRRSNPFNYGRADNQDRNDRPKNNTRQGAYSQKADEVKGVKMETSEATKQANELTVLDWRRSDDQPYLRAFPVYTHKQVFAKSRSGKIEQQIIRLGDNMDPNAHAVPYPSYMTSAAWRGNQQAAEAAVKCLHGALLAGRKKEDPFTDCDAHFEQGRLIANADGSLRSTVAIGRLWRAEKLLTQPKLQVYGVGSLVRFQMLMNELPEETREVDASLIARLAQKNTFIEVRDQLLTLSESFKRLHLNRINKMLTEHVNTILHHNLSLPLGFKMGNFIEDIDAIEDILDEDYGAKLVNAWNENQADVIGELFYQSPLPEEGETVPSTFFDHHYNIMLLTLTSGELGTEFASGVSMRLDESLSPALHDLVKTQIHELGDDGGLCTYIVTNDGMVLAATRGWLADDCYLVRPLENVYM